MGVSEINMEVLLFFCLPIILFIYVCPISRYTYVKKKSEVGNLHIVEIFSLFAISDFENRP